MDCSEVASRSLCAGMTITMQNSTSTLSIIHYTHIHTHTQYTYTWSVHNRSVMRSNVPIFVPCNAYMLIICNIYFSWMNKLDIFAKYTNLKWNGYRSWCWLPILFPRPRGPSFYRPQNGLGFRKTSFDYNTFQKPKISWCFSRICEWMELLTTSDVQTPFAVPIGILANNG